LETGSDQPTLPEGGGEFAFLRSIAERATPLWDRSAIDELAVSKQNPSKVRRRLKRWRKVLGDARILDKRLRNAGVSFAAEDLLRTTVRLSVLPSWVDILAAALAWQPTGHRQDAMVDRAFDPSSPLPFQELLVGFIRVARDCVAAAPNSALEVLQPAAATDLERQLLAHLTFVASLTFGQDFYAFRFARAPAAAIESAWNRQSTSTDIYRSYVQHMQRGGLRALLDLHPVLARLLSRSVEHWIAATVTFCRRFHDDFRALQKFFDWPLAHAENALAQVCADLSDRHHGGQTVIQCMLRTGDRIVYKPRTVKPEAAFYKFIAALNGSELTLELKVLRTFDRTTYGWMESVSPQACITNDEVAQFYRRAGMLLCVLHVLATTDIHSENLIASGEHPVVVDLETLLSESLQARSQRAGLAETQPSEDDQASVLHTGFVPQWQTAPDGHRFDTSGLGSDAAQDPGLALPRWTAINTDQMSFTRTTSPDPSMTHRVELSGRWPSVGEYLTPFSEGFREVYKCLLVKRWAILDDAELLAAFERLQLRILVRNSVTYARLHLHLLQPAWLVDGLDRSIELEWLARPLSAVAKTEPGRVLLYEAERDAMEQLDIPHFTTGDWQGMHHTLDDPDLLLMSGERDASVVRRRLEHLSETDCTNQVAIIEQAVRGRF
jgi:class II lanthipeptide synthase